MAIIKDNILCLALIFVIIILFSCASTKPINDFFGIQMIPEDQEDFIIKSYSVDNGVSYQSNIRMNPNIFAWAELDISSIIIRVVNNSADIVTISYNIDEFQLHTNEEKMYLLPKGDRFSYPSQEKLTPNSSVEFNLELPSDFWKTVGMDDQHAQSKRFVENFWTGRNSLTFLKTSIKYLFVSLGGRTDIVLKPVPEAQ